MLRSNCHHQVLPRHPNQLARGKGCRKKIRFRQKGRFYFVQAKHYPCRSRSLYSYLCTYLVSDSLRSIFFNQTIYPTFDFIYVL